MREKINLSLLMYCYLMIVTVFSLQFCVDYNGIKQRIEFEASSLTSQPEPTLYDLKIQIQTHFHDLQPQMYYIVLHNKAIPDSAVLSHYVDPKNVFQIVIADFSGFDANLLSNNFKRFANELPPDIRYQVFNNLHAYQAKDVHYERQIAPQCYWYFRKREDERYWCFRADLDEEQYQKAVSNVFAKSKKLKLNALANTSSVDVTILANRRYRIVPSIAIVAILCLLIGAIICCQMKKKTCTCDKKVNAIVT